MRILLVMALAPTFAWAAFVPPYTLITDNQDFDVKPNGAFTKLYERRIRIDTPQGIDQYGQAKLYYDTKRSKLEILEAYTIRPNGEKVSVPPERIKRLNSNTDDIAPYFSDEMTAVIIFPQVEVGSELYYKAELDMIDPVIKDRFRSEYSFTPHRKYESATIRLTYPAEMQMQIYERDLRGNKSVLPDGRVQYTVQYKQDTAYPLEPDQVSYSDFAPTVQFSNYQGYSDLAKITNDLFTPKSKVTSTVQNLADSLTSGMATPRQKAQKLYDWVSQNIRYVGIDVGASGFEPHDADTILANRYGDCKDHAVILEALLMAAGIPSSPALIKMDNSYTLPALAGKGYFDHVITYVPQFDLYLDSTAQFAEFGTLPPEDIGKPTLITQTGQVSATPNSNPKHDYTVSKTTMRLMPDGSITGSANYEPHGYFTVNSRSTQFAYENKDTQSVVDSLLKRNQESGIGEITHGNPSDLSAKWNVQSKFKLDPVINMPGPSAFSIPTGLTMGYIRVLTATKPYENRRYPYACGSDKHTEYIVIDIPKNIRVTRVPKGMSVVTKDQSYHSTYKLADNKLSVTRELVTNVGTDVCQPNQTQTKGLAHMINTVKTDLRSQIFID